MGNKQSQTPVLVSQDHIHNLINANSENNIHTAGAVETLALVAVIILVVVGLYFIYRLITNYERMRGQLQLDSVVSLSGIRNGSA